MATTIKYGSYTFDGTTLLGSDIDDIITYADQQFRFTVIDNPYVYSFALDGDDLTEITQAPSGYFEYYGGPPKNYIVSGGYGSDGVKINAKNIIDIRFDLDLAAVIVTAMSFDDLPFEIRILLDNEYFYTSDGKYYLTKEVSENKRLPRSMSEALGLSKGHDADWVVNSSLSYIGAFNVEASTWKAVVSINRSINGYMKNISLTAQQVTREEFDVNGPVGSLIKGTDADEIIRGLAGWDLLEGGAGNDLIHGGNGRDCITGGTGADELHGDFGWNTYTSQKDGYVDLIAIKSDQFLSNHWYGTTGNSPNGEKADIIEGLDSNDQIKIIGIGTSDLSFKDTVLHNGASGVGIYARGVLEALYTGGDLNASQISMMTTGDDSEIGMNNQRWSYWWDNTPPVL